MELEGRKILGGKTEMVGRFDGRENLPDHKLGQGGG